MKQEEVIEQFGERLRRIETAEPRPTLWDDWRWYGALNFPVPPVWSLFHRIYNRTGRDLHIVEIFASVDAAPTLFPVTAYVTLNGVDIFTAPVDYPSIGVGAFSDSAVPTAITLWPNGSYLNAYITGMDTGGAASDLNVQVVYHA